MLTVYNACLFLCQAYLKRTDRNIKNTDVDLLAHLHEKQKRHQRYMRSASVYGPSMPGSPRTVSPSGSMGHLNGNASLAKLLKHSKYLHYIILHEIVHSICYLDLYLKMKLCCCSVNLCLHKKQFTRNKILFKFFKSHHANHEIDLHYYDR